MRLQWKRCKRFGDPKIKLFWVVHLPAGGTSAVSVPDWRNLSRSLFDNQFSHMHRYDAHRCQTMWSSSASTRASKALKEPFALWHPYLGKFLQAMAAAKPAVVGLDIALPERSYQFLIPQYDQSLLQGLQKLKSQNPRWCWHRRWKSAANSVSVRTLCCRRRCKYIGFGGGLCGR